CFADHPWLFHTGLFRHYMNESLILPRLCEKKSDSLAGTIVNLPIEVQKISHSSDADTVKICLNF
ncbi:MAG TPA: hypothetical protein VMV55_02030, partial [Methanoregula sp.]|nr:hypothetical protein [Methanoregula sp.]